MENLNKIESEGNLSGNKNPIYDHEKQTRLTGELQQREASEEKWSDDEKIKWKQLLGTDENEKKVKKPDIKEKKMITIDLKSIKKEIDVLYTEGNPNSPEQEVKIKSLLETVTDSFDKLQQQLEKQRQRIDSLELESYLNKKEADLQIGHKDILNSFNGMFNKFKQLLKITFSREFPTTIEDQAQFLSEIEGVDVVNILDKYTPEEIHNIYEDNIGENGETYETGKEEKKDKELPPSLGEQAKFLSEIERVDVVDILDFYSPEKIYDRYNEELLNKKLRDL